jgi:hypothetical protein
VAVHAEVHGEVHVVVHVVEEVLLDVVVALYLVGRMQGLHVVLALDLVVEDQVVEASCLEDPLKINKRT